MFLNLASNRVGRFVVLAMTLISTAYARTAESGDSLMSQSDKQKSAHAFQEIVVTGSRIPELWLDSPARVEAISGESISLEHAVQLDEALKNLPGINIRSIHGKFGQEVWLQGISADRVRVLVDGAEVLTGGGSSADLSQISTVNIDRVEVVKGASSVLYGSDAMGGVINVISAAPQAGLHFTLGGDLGTWGQQDLNTEDFGYLRTRGQASLASDVGYLKAQFNARHANGWAVKPDAWDQQGEDGYRVNGDFVARYTPNQDTYLQFKHEQFQQDLHSRYSETRATNVFERDKQDAIEQRRSGLRGHHQRGPHSIELSGYVDEFSNNSQPSDVLQRDSDQSARFVGSQWTYGGLNRHQITLGAEYRYSDLQQSKTENGTETVDELLGGSVTRDSVEVFLQDQWRFERMVISPGIRWQDDSDFGDHSVAKLNTRFELFKSDAQLVFMRAAVGSGYRVPNLKERYYVFDHSQFGYMVLGNAELKPESSTSFQLGATWVADSARYELNLFRNELQNLIETGFAEQRGTLAIYKYQNIDKAITQGVEASLVLMPLDSLNLLLAWTYLEAKDEISGERLIDRPRNQLNFKLDYSVLENTQLILSGSWQDEEWDAERQSASPAWNRWDIKLNHEFNQRWRVFGGINNLTKVQKNFDGSYDNRPEESRSIYSGLSFNW